MPRKPATAWGRSSHMLVKLRPGEKADLDVIADEWEITPAQLGWVIIADWLAKRRRRRLADLPVVKDQRRHGRKVTAEVVEAYEQYEHADEEAHVPADEESLEDVPAEAGPDEG